jgi:hypothetical protein
VTSVLGCGLEPITAARAGDGFNGFINAAFGLRFVFAFVTFFFAGAVLAAVFLAGFLAADFLATVFFLAGFLAAGFLADFLAFAIPKLLDIVLVNHVIALH